MLVNIKSIGQVDFPEGTTKEQIQAILKKSFSKKKEDKALSLREIELMVKGFLKEQVKAPDPIVPDVKVELEPSFEMNADIDVSPIAKAIAKLEIPAPEVSVNVEKPDIPTPEVIVNVQDKKGWAMRMRVETRTRSGAIDTVLLWDVSGTV